MKTNSYSNLIIEINYHLKDWIISEYVNVIQVTTEDLTEEFGRSVLGKLQTLIDQNIILPYKTGAAWEYGTQEKPYIQKNSIL